MTISILLTALTTIISEIVNDADVIVYNKINLLVRYRKHNTPFICTEYKQHMPQFILFIVLYGRS